MPKSKPKVIDYDKPYPGTAKDATLFGWCGPSLARPEVAAAIHGTCLKSFTFYDKTVTCECGCHNAQEVTSVSTAVPETDQGAGTSAA